MKIILVKKTIFYHKITFAFIKLYLCCLYYLVCETQGDYFSKEMEVKSKNICRQIFTCAYFYNDTFLAENALRIKML
jgi:hypothetical protein